MATTGLSHINFRAPRPLLDELKDFYCDVVGLEIGARPPFPGFGYWLYAGGLPIVHLYETQPSDTSPVAAVTTFDHIAFDCSGMQEIEQRLQARKVKYRLAVVPASNQTQIFLRDPAGNRVELNFGNV